MTDTLKQIAVNVHCDGCGDFTVGADVIAESQRLLAQGCPGSPHECPPQLLATLLDPSALEWLEQARSTLEDAAVRAARCASVDADLHLAVPHPIGSLAFEVTEGAAQ